MDTIIRYLPIFSSIFSLIVLVVIKFNDLTHFDKMLTEIKIKVGEIDKRLIDHESRISRIEGKINND